MAMAAVRSAANIDEDQRDLWVGRSIARVEDAALLSGRGRFIDDLGIPPGTLHAAIRARLMPMRISCRSISKPPGRHQVSLRF